MHQQMQTAASIAIVISLSAITPDTVTNSPGRCPVLMCHWLLLASLNIAYDLYFLNPPFHFFGSSTWSLYYK